MKKLICCFLFFILLFNTKVYASTISASEYILMDMDSGRILEGKDYNNPRLIASITKIMTCVIAIESNKLNEVVIVDDSISKAYGSGIYIKVGEELTLKDLLYGLMLRSGNDAALMIANFVSKTEENFVKQMNNKAREIGMKHTIFKNSSGLDENNTANYSTAYDMALLTKYAMQYKEYREITSTKQYSLKTNKNYYIWHNKNKLLQEKYITGGKTGYTKKAGRTLVTTASFNNLNLIVVTIKDSDDWNTHKSLYQKATKEYRTYKVLDKNNFIIKEDYYKNKLYIKKDFYMALKDNETNKVSTKIELQKITNYQNNQKVGECLIYLDNNLINKIDIYVTSKKKHKKRFWEWIKFW